MQINSTNIANLFKGFRVIFNESFQAVTPQHPALAMKVASNKAAEVYHMLAALPGMKKFVNEAQLDNLGAISYQIDNEEWEDTLAVKRKDIERDSLGFYNPLMASLGVVGAEHPDELVANVLLAGFTAKDYTDKNFFDVEKPHNPNDGKAGKFSNKGTKKLSADNYSAAKAALKALKNGAGRPLGLGRKLLLVVSPANEDLASKILKASLVNQGETNIQQGTAELLVLNRLGDSPAWFLIEAGLPFKPIIYQEEVPVSLNALTDPTDSHVMLKQEFIFQAYGRYNVGYGLPQLIWGSTGADAA